MTSGENFVQCGTVNELCAVVACFVREGINYVADYATLRVYTTGGF